MSVTTGAVGGKERAGANTLLVVLLIAAILVAVLDFGWLTYNASQDAKASALVTKIQVLSQQLSTVANAAAGGNIDAFKSLEQTRNTVDDLMSSSRLISDPVAEGRLAIVGANYRLGEGTAVPQVAVGIDA